MSIVSLPFHATSPSSLTSLLCNDLMLYNSISPVLSGPHTARDIVKLERVKNCFAYSISQLVIKIWIAQFGLPSLERFSLTLIITCFSPMPGQIRAV